jgi:hypothetical protein
MVTREKGLGSKSATAESQKIESMALVVFAS